MDDLLLKRICPTPLFSPPCQKKDGESYKAPCAGQTHYFRVAEDLVWLRSQERLLAAGSVSPNRVRSLAPHLSLASHDKENMTILIFSMIEVELMF